MKKFPRLFHDGKKQKEVDYEKLIENLNKNKPKDVFDYIYNYPEINEFIFPAEYEKMSTVFETFMSVISNFLPDWREQIKDNEPGVHPYIKRVSWTI